MWTHFSGRGGNPPWRPTGSGWAMVCCSEIPLAVRAEEPAFRRDNQPMVSRFWLNAAMMDVVVRRLPLRSTLSTVTSVRPGWLASPSDEAALPRPAVISSAAGDGSRRDTSSARLPTRSDKLAGHIHGGGQGRRGSSGAVVARLGLPPIHPCRWRSVRPCSAPMDLLLIQPCLEFVRTYDLPRNLSVHDCINQVVVLG